MIDASATVPPPDAFPLTALRWTPAQVVALVVFAAVLNVAQALALRAAGVSEMSGELPHFIRAVVVFAYYALIAAPVVVSARRHGVSVSAAVGLRDVGSWTNVAGWAVIVVFVARAAAYAWVVLASALGLRLPGGTVDITRIFGTSLAGALVTVAVAVLVGPFVEELVFRGVAYAQLERTQGVAGALLGSSAMFGLLHLNPLEFVPLVAAGALFAWVFRRTRTLWAAVLAHSLFNLVAVVAFYSLKSGR